MTEPAAAATPAAAGPASASAPAPTPMQLPANQHAVTLTKAAEGFGLEFEAVESEKDGSTVLDTVTVSGYTEASGSPTEAAEMARAAGARIGETLISIAGTTMQKKSQFEMILAEGFLLRETATFVFSREAVAPNSVAAGGAAAGGEPKRRGGRPKGSKKAKATELDLLTRSPGSGGRTLAASRDDRLADMQKLQAAVAEMGDTPRTRQATTDFPFELAEEGVLRNLDEWLEKRDEMEQGDHKSPDLLVNERRGLTGKRIVDMELVDKFVDELRCKSCANQRYEKILDDFIEYAKKTRDLKPKDTAWLDSAALSFKRSASRTGMMTVEGSKGKMTCVREEATGLASTFFFDCPCCHFQPKLSTSKTFVQRQTEDETTDERTQMFETNIRASYASLNIGRGAEDVFDLCAYQDIPLNASSWKSMHRRNEAVFGECLESVTASAIDRARTQLRTACADAGVDTVDINGKQMLPITLQVDGCWDKRGTGHIYDSNHGTVTGWVFFPDGTRKILFLYNFQISCRVCTAYRKMHSVAVVPGDVRKEHQCRENHRDAEGAPKSAGSMEPAGVVKMCQVANSLGFWVQNLVMDDDSSTPARTMRHADPKKDKCELDEGLEVEMVFADPSHRIRVQGKHVYGIAGKTLDGEQTGDVRFNRPCAGQVKQYFSRILYEHRGRLADTVATAEERQAYVDHMWQAVEHMFGRCDVARGSRTGRSCNEFFPCPNLRKEFDEDGKLVPYKPTFECGIVGQQKQWAYRYLKGEALNREIDKIVTEHTQEHKVIEVLHKLDSQNTEAGHKSYTSKRPKERPYYGAGKSSDFRIAASAGELLDGIAPYHDAVLHEELGFESTFTNQMLGQKQNRREQIRKQKTTEARKQARVDNRNESQPKYDHP